jgi:uncharacterized membrane protein
MQYLIRTLRPILPMWPWLIATIFCAGIVHIAAVFAVPYLATRDAWARVTSISEKNQLYLLPVANKDPVLPYMLPDVAYAICRYDLTRNNVLIHTALADATWNIAISDRYGQNFYFISGAEAKRRELRLLLVPRDRLSEEASTEHSEEGDEQIIVVTPNASGLVVIRAPLRGTSFASDTVNTLQDAACKPVALPDPGVATPLPIVDEPAPAVQPARRPSRRPQGRNRRNNRNGLPG